ncbi:uncharacterized protein PAN0_019d5759 [Moesziomyces antarcticus]|uniref:Uncharacterized protein n=1 Tax=Pseudozyma antarctica TaxID=84753 RepID=A0A081CLI5_PSEA2|nr:uncharacterized protein PAN0_019d5759 [Moesziomyces antarcticus]GAK67531.1 hypothetical protein PAN0_019d5759 [Moesziomyces antarcticus]
MHRSSNSAFEPPPHSSQIDWIGSAAPLRSATHRTTSEVALVAAIRCPGTSDAHRRPSGLSIILPADWLPTTLALAPVTIRSLAVTAAAAAAAAAVHPA